MSELGNIFVCIIAGDRVAQWIEQLPSKEWVKGSSPFAIAIASVYIQKNNLK